MKAQSKISGFGRITAETLPAQDPSAYRKEVMHLEFCLTYSFFKVLIKHHLPKIIMLSPLTFLVIAREG